MVKIKIIYIYSTSIPAASPYWAYLPLSYCDVPELVAPIMIFLIDGLLLTRKLLKQVFLVEVITSIVTVVFMTWLTVLEYLCHRWPWMCFVCRSYNLVFLSSFLIYHQRSVVELVIKLIIWLAIITWFIPNHIIS